MGSDPIGNFREMWVLCILEEYNGIPLFSLVVANSYAWFRCQSKTKIFLWTQTVSTIAKVFFLYILWKIMYIGFIARYLPLISSLESQKWTELSLSLTNVTVLKAGQTLTDVLLSKAPIFLRSVLVNSIRVIYRASN